MGLDHLSCPLCLQLAQPPLNHLRYSIHPLTAGQFPHLGYSQALPNRLTPTKRPSQRLSFLEHFVRRRFAKDNHCGSLVPSMLP